MNKLSIQFFLLCIILFNVESFSQVDYKVKDKIVLKPMLSFGTGSYIFKGDIMGPKKNFMLGNQGYHIGVKMNMSNNLDLTFLLGNGRLNEINDVDNTSFSSDIKTTSLGIRYNFDQVLKQTKVIPFLSLGAEFLNYKTNKQANATSMSIPMGAGIMLDISEKIGFDMGLRYHSSFTDMIDNFEEGSGDKFLVTTFTIHYDLFSSKIKPVDPYSDQSYYAEVNFKALDVEDTDGDLVKDIDDYCPETPEGVKVDINGCPIDDDKDGIPNYIDKEANTPRGAIVNEKGVQLTDTELQSMYGEFNAASREYATFYNQDQISKDDFKSINEYLIAKANAFNIANNIPSITETKGKFYAVKLGEYIDEVPAPVIHKLLSFEDLTSEVQSNGVVVYFVGSYTTLEKALNRQSQLEINEEVDNSEIIEVENGVVSRYNPFKSSENDSIFVKGENNNKVITEEQKDTTLSLNEESSAQVVINSEKSKDDIIFRVQIGAYKVPLSKNIFEGVPSVISVTTKDGFTRYFTGAFSNYKKAVQHQNDMLLRGFEGSFVVAFKNGKKIGLYSAIRDEYRSPSRKIVLNSREIKNQEEANIQYIVQIGIYKRNLPSDIADKMSNIENVERSRVKNSPLFEYNAGTYTNYDAANLTLERVRKLGFNNAFVKFVLDGKQISFEQAQTLISE